MALIARVLLLALTLAATSAVAAEEAVCVENATVSDLRDALAAGRTTAADLVRAYTARIEAYDRAGPRLNAVRELNPDALAIAEKLDARKSGTRRPLEGIPILYFPFATHRPTLYYARIASITSSTFSSRAISFPSSIALS